jgi:phage major head subunit gpT-like protein
MAVVARGSFRKLYTDQLPFLEETIYNSYEEHPEQYSKVLNMKTSTRMKETDLMIADYGLFDPKDEGTDLTMDQIQESYQKDFLNVTYGKAIEITKEALQDDEFSVMSDRAVGLGFAARQTVEQIAFDACFNSGFTTGLSADQVAIYGSHNLTRGGTFNNSTSSDLDLGAFEDALTNFADLKDEAGKKINMQPYCLIVGTALEGVARRLLNSQYLPGSDVNDVNDYIQSRNIMLVVSNYLSSTTSWFLTAMPRYIKAKFFWRQRPEVESDVDFMSKSGLTSMDFRCTAGTSDWRGCYGSPGS